MVGHLARQMGHVFTHSLARQMDHVFTHSDRPELLVLAAVAYLKVRVGSGGVTSVLSTFVCRSIAAPSCLLPLLQITPG